MSDSDIPPELPNIEELLARVAPPGTPDEALALAPQMMDLVLGLDPLKAVAIIGGLATDPRFQAHQIRLDYTLRIVLAMARGSRKPRQTDLAELLNAKLVQARVARLEDPIEDFFVESLLTREGEFLLFSGGWEKASIHTEMILNAFRRLPNGEPKARAERQAFALLQLSTELVRRAGVEAGTIGGGSPNGDISVPSDTRLATLAARVRFTDPELRKLGISAEDVEPFFLAPSDRSLVGSREPGSSPLEFSPLFKTRNGLIVGAPANISTAVRALLISTAMVHDLSPFLHLKLLEAKAMLLNQTGFRPIPRGRTSICDDQLYSEVVIELSAGRFLHVILSVDGFAGWPDRAFGSSTPSSQELVDAIIGSMRRARVEAAESPNFVEGMTLWLCGGWGAGRSFEYIAENELPDWTFTAVEPADMATMTICEDGKLSDIWRLQKQVSLVGEQGFQFFATNGLLNLFNWWRTSDHALVPPQEIDAAPPLSINFDTNLLLDARKEALNAFGRRVVQDEQGRWHMVARLERGEQYQALQHVYGSLDDAQRAVLAGVVADQGSKWWIRLRAADDQMNRDTFETWRTVLIWAGQVLPKFLSTVKVRDIVDTIGFDVTADGFPDGYDFRTNPAPSDHEIDEALIIATDLSRKNVSIHLKPKWFAGFYRADNYAERAMAVSLLRGACAIFGIERSSEDLQKLVLASVGSTDFRHRHAFLVQRPIDYLVSGGLISSFSKIPTSAAALAKCGSTWRVHPRSEGVRIEGKEQCLSLIRRVVDDCQARLLADVAIYNRQPLIVSLLDGLQSAMAEEAHWRRSARALRAIHGVERDFELSLDHVMAANGVLRANSMLVEIAAVEARPEGGRPAGTMDIEELQARALQVFQTADNYPAFLADRIEPAIHISPTGDMLFQHDFHEAAIARNAELRHARERSASSDEYVRRFEPERPGKDPDSGFIPALQAEYRVPVETFRELAAVTATLARQKGQGVMILRRSEFVTAFRQFDFLSGLDFEPLIDRLILPHRANWREIPSGCTPRDFDLSKFDRRYSLIGRPIVSLSSDPDPLLAVAPGLIERALAHNVSGAAQGLLQNEFWTSPEMRAYSGTAGARLGIEFNEDLARQLSALGYTATASVKPSACLNQKATEELKRLGDIDVLVVAGGTRVWVCEAKDLKMCRTLGEAASRLSEYRGQVMKNGKPDKLLRHLQRVDYIRRHSAQLGKRLGLAAEPTVHGVMIVNSPQPMQQLAREYSKDSTVVMLDRIQSVPWTDGW
ncbi:hypothetical protein [Bradyrhizobium sp. CCGUVB23]|uniref:hypothetical protein n=1 Tax=Bradyrhizobium sp. CCGUVB23 TaxID=2949630 RepID=UPI0020B2340D|nr:hypothetical protein [Bradyrhizobium sp. CCGUVB23]MCP3463067.1 hypothetical protein [Bradyrhizobium sp. CCGUVB23]